MSLPTAPLRLPLVLCLAWTFSCATAQTGTSEAGNRVVLPSVVHVTALPEDRLQLGFEPLPPDLLVASLGEEDVRATLNDFLQSFPEASHPPVLPVRASPERVRAPWEQRLRAEFLARYGPGWLPIPDSIQSSPLYMALRMSPRYMGHGLRAAAQELFRSPAFLVSVALSVLVYFSAWVLPEPLFSKAFAATLTVRLALVVGLLELRNAAWVVLQLYRDVQAARTMQELEAAAERFGRALGGTALRVLVTVASFGVARALPNVPPGGLGGLLGPPRYAMAGGVAFQSAKTAHVMADGTIVIAGAALGTAASSARTACGDGSLKDGYQWHHLATDKNGTSGARGGPWTPLFKALFDRAEMSLDDPANRIYLAGHHGPHPEEYHRAVYRKLDAALEGCPTVTQCRQRLVEALKQIADEVCTPGSRLHRLVAKAQG